jgi:hypothetical protein
MVPVSNYKLMLALVMISAWKYHMSYEFPEFIQDVYMNIGSIKSHISFLYKEDMGKNPG